MTSIDYAALDGLIGAARASVAYNIECNGRPESLTGVIALLDALDELADRQDSEARCGARCSHGGSCSLTAGHAGRHEARNVAGDVAYCSWEGNA